VGVVKLVVCLLVTQPLSGTGRAIPKAVGRQLLNVEARV
jgi:hypothetical protein